MKKIYIQITKPPFNNPCYKNVWDIVAEEREGKIIPVLIKKFCRNINDVQWSLYEFHDGEKECRQFISDYMDYEQFVSEYLQIEQP